MTISPLEILAFIGGATSLTTAIFMTAVYIGRISVRLDRHEDRLDAHDAALSRLRAQREMDRHKRDESHENDSDRH